MMKLIDKGVDKLFKDVTKNWFSYLESGTIKLDGNFCSDELREIAKVLDLVNKQSLKTSKEKDG